MRYRIRQTQKFGPASEVRHIAVGAVPIGCEPKPAASVRKGNQLPAAEGWLSRNDPEHGRERKRSRDASELGEPTLAYIRHKQLKAWKRTEVEIGARATARRVTDAEIRAAQIAPGEWTREQLAEWGVPWPAPRGWRTALLVGLPMPKCGRYE